jgi:DNA-binding NtrC family response regulator
MEMPSRILVVDDEAAMLASTLRQRGYPAEGVAGHACLDELSCAGRAVVLIDTVPETSGLELCHRLRDRYPRVLPIVLTGRREPDVAIAAMRAGAFDYLTKPVSIPVLEDALARALGHLTMQSELDRLREAPLEQPLADVVASSPAIQRTLDLARRVAASDATVLVTGESGAGKERIAAAIHRFSSRRHERFVAINCSAMTAPLIESELFGHAAGAFSGADRERVGLFLHAAGGTILLDEVADMPLEMQAKLLRVLQERSVRPLGSDEEVPLHARILAATSRDLEVEVATGRFRQDLYHRINVVAVHVPPLRERREDVLPLAQMMLRRCATRVAKRVETMSPATARALRAYSWPGNVRELENCIERAVAVCRLDQITIDDLPDKIRVASGARGALAPGVTGGFATLTEMKVAYVRKALAVCGGNKSLAARVLGIDRRTITSLLVPPGATGSTSPIEN